MNTLLELMKALNRTDDEYARLFDVSRSTVRRWRKGTTTPHNKMIVPLCSVLEKEIKSDKKGEVSAD